ncbi:hypothetical protein NMY22_g6861 [Coprinellus aureogranulatus]|nr:hypothetical protein NMY22_g6861 [Coprinellus aureogranulatus]
MYPTNSEWDFPTLLQSPPIDLSSSAARREPDRPPIGMSAVTRIGRIMMPGRPAKSSHVPFDGVCDDGTASPRSPSPFLSSSSSFPSYPRFASYSRTKTTLFTRASRKVHHLARHIRVHRGEVEYVCQFSGCEKICSSPDALQKHHLGHKSKGSSPSIPFTQSDPHPVPHPNDTSHTPSHSSLPVPRLHSTHVTPGPHLVPSSLRLDPNLEPQTWDKDTYRQFLACRMDEARVLIDKIQRALYAAPHPKPVNNRAHRLKFLLRLSKIFKLLPSNFYLWGIKDALIMDGKFLLKRYRVYDGSITEEERAELLNREAIVWANHQHAGVLPFLGVFQQGNDADYNELCLVSPFLEHGTVVSYLKSHPTANRCLLMRDILGAMTYLHSNDIIHGDIKGVNVLVDSSGRACVADLGFSRLTSAAVLTWTSVRSVATVATIPWQAPELLECLLDEESYGDRGERLVKPTKEADVYSIGCLTYEVFTNQLPFWDVSPRKLMMRPADIVTAVVIGKQQPTRPEPQSDAYSLCGLTDELWSMMESCWARKPSLRPTASQLSKLPCFVTLVDDRPFLESSHCSS